MTQQDLTLWESATNELTMDNEFKNESNIIFKALKSVIKDMAKEAITEDEKKEISKRVEEKVIETFGGVPQKIELHIDGEVREITGTLHYMFEEVLQFVAEDVPVYLVGPAGSGKNVLAKQIAEALGLDYYYTNCVTQEYKIAGYGNAAGLYVDTPFYNAFTKGGLFLLDELDASIPEVLDILNMAIANRYCDFPNVGNKQAHPNFRVIAAGNTCGEGANSMYSSRMKLDAASLDRFAIVEVDYAPQIEESISKGNSALCDFLRGVRKVAKASGIEMVVSYRAFERMVKMEPKIGAKRAIKTCVLKCLPKDDVQIIVGGLKERGLSSNKYTQVVEEIVKGMEE